MSEGREDKTGHGGTGQGVCPWSDFSRKKKSSGPAIGRERFESSSVASASLTSE